MKLTSDAIVKLGCSETTSIAYALAFSQDKQKEFLEEKNVWELSSYVYVINVHVYDGKYCIFVVLTTP